MKFVRQPRLCVSLAIGLLLLVSAFAASAACVDSVVLVHGNSSNGGSWSNTRNLLLSKGYSSSQIHTPTWGSQSCGGVCNDHSGSEETPVRNAISSALSSSCTGRIDVIGHSMGVTLAMQQILKLGVAGRVDSFVGIAGAVRGLNSCGTYPYNVWNSTCGAWGLSKKSKLVESLRNKRVASRIYSIKSYNDGLVCAGGWAYCYVEGTHTSNVWYQNASYDYNSYGHFDLYQKTAQKQYDLIR